LLIDKINLYQNHL